jgi:RimJ/RimL family protein N-acetyltransferase
MRHNIILAGLAFRLRPIADADAPLVLELRGDATRNQHIHATSQIIEDQLAWFARYYERPGDYYFVIERLDTGVPDGVISIYDIDDKSACGEWGRWIVKPGSLAAVESAWLIYRCAFEQLGLERVYCRTVADNQQVVSFHDSCGITDRRLLPGQFEIGGKHVDAVEHQVTRQAWSEFGPRLKRLAELTARRVQRG